MAEKLYDFKAKLIRETAKAYLLETEDGREVWLPMFCTENNKDGTWTTTQEMAEDKELV